jgi:energy-converting hydrogenase Eha subunit H
MNEKQYVPAQLPGDVDERLLAIRRMLALRQGLPETKVSKTGDVMRYVLDMADAAEALGVKPAAQAQA